MIQSPLNGQNGDDGREIVEVLADQRPITVLHVDDDPSFADLVSIYLEREGEAIEVLTEHGPEDGLERLAADRIDCVVSDYDMPGTDGLEFLETVREEHPELPFILFTGKGSEEIASEAISRGVTDYLQKGGGTEQYAVLANRIENVAERHQVEREVERGFLAIETAREGISFLDEEGTFTYVNGAYADLYGYDREELIGEHWELLYPEGHVSQVHQEILPAVPEQGHWSGESVHVRADGTRLVVDHALTCATDGTLLCLVRDTTERKETERVLEQERRRRERQLARQLDQFERFGSVLSHDVATPLTTARGRLELARETGDPEHLEGVESALDRIEELVDDLAGVMREGELVSEPVRVGLGDCARAVWAGLEAGDAALTVQEGSVRADEAALKRLLENLLKNAVDHGGDRVTVGLLADGFYVADDGEGIPADERERVFEAGYSPAGGSGFGLASVDQLVVAHGWEIAAVESEDGGARFEITGVERPTPE